MIIPVAMRHSGGTLSPKKEADNFTQLHDHQEEPQEAQGEMFRFALPVQPTEIISPSDPRKFYSEVRSLFNEIIMIVGIHHRLIVSFCVVLIKSRRRSLGVYKQQFYPSSATFSRTQSSA
jgi:hypothetical protein